LTSFPALNVKVTLRLAVVVALLFILTVKPSLGTRGLTKQAKQPLLFFPVLLLTGSGE